MSCLAYGTRKYVSNVSMKNPIDLDEFSLIPSMTATYGQPTPMQSGDNPNWQFSSCKQESYPNTNFVACGSSGDYTSTFMFSACCVTSWDQTNKSKCCDPSSNALTNDSVACDPAFCPFSPACVDDPVTSTYCQANPTDADCLSNCTSFINDTSKAPAWCTTFVPEYCQAKSANNQQLSLQDSSLCACLTNQTSVDECFLETCVDAPSGTAWLTSAQLKHQADPTYCGQQCKNIAQAVANETYPMNSVTYLKVCSEVPLPPSTVPPDQLPSNQPAPSGWTLWWGNIQQFFKSITTLNWIIVGIVCFIIIVGVIIRQIMKSTGETLSSVPTPPTLPKPPTV
jgi:hypothetical protein